MLFRSGALPGVPTFDESGYRGVDASTYWNSLAPSATPRDAIATLNAAMNKALQLPDLRNRLLALGFEPIVSTPDSAAAAIRSDLAKWARVVKQANIRPE